MKKIYLIFFAFISQILFSQDGTLDLSFNPNDTGLGNGDEIPFYAPSDDYSIQQGNKLIVIGSHFPFQNNYNNVDVARSIFRLNANGTFDNTFKAGNFTLDNGSTHCHYRLLVRPNNKIIVFGDFTKYNGNSVNGCLQLNEDGTFDNTFNLGLVNGLHFYGQTGKILPDGKLILAGDNYNATTYVRYLVRFNIDGSLDSSFGINNLGINMSSRINFFCKDNNLIIYGGIGSYNGNIIEGGYLKLNQQGRIDTSFPQLKSISIYSIEETEQNGLLISGFFKEGNSEKYNIYKLNSDYSINPNFALTDTEFHCTEIKKQGNKFILTSLANNQGKIIRINESGSIDNTFKLITTDYYDLLLKGNNSKIQLTNDAIYISTIFKKYDPNGNPSLNYRKNTGFNGEVTSIKSLPNGKLMVAGAFTKYNNQDISRVVRLNLDGTIDSSFNYAPQHLFNNKSSITLLGNRVLVYDTGSVDHFELLDENGYLIENFSYPYPYYPKIYKADENSFFTVTENSYPHYYTIQKFKFENDTATRFNTDYSFNTNITYSGLIKNIIPKENGKFIIHGLNKNTYYYSDGISTSPTPVFQLNSDGSFDKNIDLSGEFGDNEHTHAISIFPTSYDNLIISDFNNKKTIKINDNCITENSFNYFDNGNSVIYDCIDSPNNKMTLLIKNESIENWFYEVIRINNDGSIDNSFKRNKSQKGFKNDDELYSYINPNGITEQFDGKIIVFGNFVKFDNYSKNRILRLNSNSTSGAGIESKDIAIYPNPISNGILNISKKSDYQVPLSIYDLKGSKIKTVIINPGNNQYNLSGLQKGLYLLKSKNFNGKIIIN